jgi:hypothetical protein
MEPQETAKAAAAFHAYCELGPTRSLEKVCERVQNETGKRPRLASLKEWSSKYNWVERAKQYDEEQREHEARLKEQEAKRRIAREERRARARERMEDERAEIYRAEHASVLRAINDKVKSGDTRGIVGLVSLLKVSLDEERTSLGATPVQQVDITSNGNTVGQSLVTPESIASMHSVIIAELRSWRQGHTYDDDLTSN